MSDTTSERGARLATLLSTVSVLSVAVGMSAAQGAESTFIKGEAPAGASVQLKGEHSQIKFWCDQSKQSTQIKLTNAQIQQGRSLCNQLKQSTQIKLNNPAAHSVQSPRD